MVGYQGFIDAESGGTLLFTLRSPSGAPVEPDSAPTFKIVGPQGYIGGSGMSGSASSLESGNVTGATNASPIVISYSPSGVAPVVVGQSVTIASVGGNTAANGEWTVSAVTSTSFTLSGSTGNGAYTSGGTWKTTGLYKITVPSSGLTPGQTYKAVLSWLEGGERRVGSVTFTIR